MFRFALACLGVAFVSASSAALGAPDLDKVLSAEEAADTKASENAECWCKDFLGHVSSRMSLAADEMQRLEHIQATQGFENDRLEIEIKEHMQEAHDHADSKNSLNHMHEGATAEHEEEVAELKSSLRSVRKAKEAMGAGGSGEAYDTLSRLEKDFEAKLERSENSHDTKQERHEELQESAAEMERLSQTGAATKNARFAKGQVVVQQCSAQIAAYESQLEEDAPVNAAAKTLCDTIEAQAAERKSKRQQVMVAHSQAKAEHAEKKAMHAAMKLTLLSKRHNASTRIATDTTHVSNVTAARDECEAGIERAEDEAHRASAALDGAKQSASTLISGYEKSSDVEATLRNMLQGVFMDMHLAENAGLPADVQAAVAAYGETAKSHKEALAEPFGKVRSLGKKSTLADSRLVTKLMTARAQASQDLITAKQCSGHGY